MITNTEASIFMSLVVDQAKKNLLKDGYSYPVFVVMTKDRDHMVSISNPNFTHIIKTTMVNLEVTNTEKGSFVLENNTTNPDNFIEDYIKNLLNNVEKNLPENDYLNYEKYETHPTFYISLVQTKADPSMDKFDNHNIARALALDTDADCIGHVSSCLYKLYLEGDDFSEQSIQRDPDVSKVIYGTYYTKKDNEPMDCIIPYINRGELNNIYEESTYDILAGHSGWMKKPIDMPIRLRNPFQDDNRFDSLL